MAKVVGNEYIGKRHYSTNVSSTPGLGDPDADALLDLDYCHEINPVDLLSIKQKKG